MVHADMWLDVIALHSITAIFMSEEWTLVSFCCWLFGPKHEGVDKCTPVVYMVGLICIW